MIKINLQHSSINSNELKNPKYAEMLKTAHAKLFLSDATENAWLNLPLSVDFKELDHINETAKWVHANFDVFLVIGVGGSYLGAAAGLQMLTGPDRFPIEFLGTSFDAKPYADFANKYKNKRICVNVISKSGTTLEISAALDYIEKTLSIKKSSFIFTTDANKGMLRDRAIRDNIALFVVPDRVGGRYSVLSAVGLLPFAVGGIDINAITMGAKQAYEDLRVVSSDAHKYALARYLLHTKYQKDVEVFASFYEGLGNLGGWHQQLFCESEGKDGKGIFVSPMIFTRDLHSMGQYIQQGQPILFETIVDFEKSMHIVGNFNKFNHAAIKGVVKAHTDANVPVIILNAQAPDALNFGYMVYFFEVACAINSYLLGVNPFDQPGVEFYKKNMREFLN